MKTLQLKKLTLVLTVIATVSFSSVIKAEEVVLPIISRPAILQEGTQRELSAEQIADLLPWAKNSKVFLADLLDNVQGLTTQEKIERLVEGFKQVVGESAPKYSELLMRYSLNRGLVINEILNKEMSADAVGSQDAKLRVLISSMNIAIKYYDADIANISKKTPVSFVAYGLDYFNFLSELNKSIFDASAQYMIQRTALEWLQWDLYRDVNNTSYASQIVKINNALKTFPAKDITDEKAIKNIKLMKKTAQQLDVAETLKTVLANQKRAAEEEEKAAEDRVRRSKRVVQRTAEQIGLIKKNLAILSSNTTRQDRENAIDGLYHIPGADITLGVLPVLINDSNEQVAGEAFRFLISRLNAENKLLSRDSAEELNSEIVTYLGDQWFNHKNTVRRRYSIKILVKIGSAEADRILGQWATHTDNIPTIYDIRNEDIRYMLSSQDYDFFREI